MSISMTNIQQAIQAGVISPSQAQALAQQLLGSQQGLMGIQPQAVTPSPPSSGEILYMVGSQYDVTKQDKWYKLRYVARVGKEPWIIAWWEILPSRSLVASTIRWHRSILPRVNARDEYGMLLGVRYFKINEDFHLASPHMGTVWETSTLTATTWSDEDAVRGKYGIHASWPTRGSQVIPSIDYKNTQGLVIGQVRGHGRTVLGTEGWRAEKAIIDTIYLPQALFSRWRVLKRLHTLYPDVTFLEEPWTLERSSKSAR